jgi:aminoglycoside phosphotransferase family enzyme
MRRMPSDRRLARCLERGEDVSDALRVIARDVAALHAASVPSALVRVGARDAVREHWRDGFAQMAPFVGVGLDAATQHEIESLAQR